MKVCTARGVGAAVFAAALASTAAAAVDGRHHLESQFGLPLFDAAGQRLNYQQSELATLPLTAAAKVTASAVPSEAAGMLPAVLSEPVTKSWSYGLFGAGIGLSGIVVMDTGSGLEIFVAGTASSQFGDNDHWLALRKAGGDYRQTFNSSQSASAIVSLAAADLDGNGANELLVLHDDGSVEVFAAATKERLQVIATGVASPTRLRVADVDGDGSPELLVVNASDLFIIGADGVLERRVDGAGGYDVLAAQMDDDVGIEIACTNGTIFDVATGAIQWTRSGGFGSNLAAADTDGDGRAELIAAEDWYSVWAYDVERQLPQWSIAVPLDIGAIQFGDVNNDGAPELLVGDGQWGEVRVYDPATQAVLGAIDNPEHGVTSIAVADVDADGKQEVLWGAGATSTGEDHLYIARPLKQRIVWQSIDLVGPFVGPRMGDVNGDGKLELVVASTASDADYGSGRILVFAGNGRLLGISPPVVEDLSWTGVHDLKLRDLDGDGSAEIIIAADRLYDGVIEAWGFNAGSFTLKWTNATQPEGAPFYSVDAYDVDGDGNLEIVGGGGREHTGAAGVFVYLYDYATQAEKWHSMQCGAYWDEIADLGLLDIDGDGNTEIVGLLGSGDVYFFDGSTKGLDAILDGSFTALGIRASTGALFVGDATGGISPVRVRDGIFSRGTVTDYGASAVDGMAFGPLLVGSGQRVSLWESGLLRWQSESGGVGYGRTIARLPGKRFATAGLSSVDVFLLQ